MSVQEAKWYVVHTYSGYENKVKEDLEKSVENAGLQDIILEVKYPTEETIEILPNGKRKVTQRKVFPGYVMVKMLVDVFEKERPAEQGGGKSIDLVMNPRAWYVVRNTRGVTGFVGPDSKPVALTPEEVNMMLSTQINSVEFGIAIGEEVRILSGPLENFTGVVEDVDTVRQKLTVKVKMFLGREMPVEVDLQDVVKV